MSIPLIANGKEELFNTWSDEYDLKTEIDNAFKALDGTTAATWASGIYQLEVDDYAIGYNPDTGEDGTANLQAEQLGNRTQWLYCRFLKEHTKEGVHSLTSKDFSDTANIPESKLDLDYSTEGLAELFTINKNLATYILSAIEAMDDTTMSTASSVKKILPLADEYSYYVNVYELFSPAFSLRGSTTNAIKLAPPQNVPDGEVTGDDTLDLESTATLSVGETYVLFDEDGGRPEPLTVATILENGYRIRCTTNAVNTRQTGYFGRTSLIMRDGGCYATNPNWFYVSDYITNLEDRELGGMLYVCRDIPESGEVTPKAYYKLYGSSTYSEAPFVKSVQQLNGTIIDSFSIPEGKLSFKLEYTGTAPEYQLWYIVVTPNMDILHVDLVRRPEVKTATKWEDEQVRVELSTYGTMYEVPHKTTKIRLLSNNYISDPYKEYEFTATSGAINLEIPLNMRECGTMYVQVQYIDNEDTASRWSATKKVSD